MDEQTTTAEQVEDTGAQDALPAQDQQDAAALTANEQQEDQTQGDASASLPAVDDKLETFAKGLGIEDVSGLSERELKLLKVAKDNQAEFQRTAQKASELEKTMSASAQQAITDAANSGTVDDAQLALAQVAALKLENSVSRFFSENPDAKLHERNMVDLVTNRPELKQMIQQGALGVSDLYAMVKGSDPTVVATAEEQGGKKALQQLANKQAASAVPGSATTSAVSPPASDPIMDVWKSD